jgi:hypothetical protein
MLEEPWSRDIGIGGRRRIYHSGGRVEFKSLEIPSF